MKAEARQLGDIITNKKLYRIPFFQRSYVWEEEQWERFAKDMEELIDRRSPYFLGSIILKEDTPSENDYDNGIERLFDVVDGQQRLTTLFIYLKLLYTTTGMVSAFDSEYQYRYGNNDVYMPLLKHNHFDSRNFNRVMRLQSAHRQEGADGISKAFEFFRQRYENWNNVEDKRRLIRAIKTYIRFVEILVEEADDEQQIFDTINSLGVDLNTDELMKNFLYKSEEDQQNYTQNWQPVFDGKDASNFWKADALTGKKCDKKEHKAIENFFHAFVRIKMNDTRLNLTPEQKKLFKRTDYTFKACKTFVDQGISREELAQEIVEYAQKYKDILDPEAINRAIPTSGAMRLAYIILATNTKTLIPYFLYILKNVNDKDEQNLIFDYLEKYIIRRKLAMPAEQNKSYSELFGESLILNNIQTTEQLRTFIEGKDITDNLAMPDNRMVTNGIKGRNNKLDEKTARTILYLIEQKANCTFDKSLNDLFATTLMPEKATGGWSFNETQAQRERRIQRTKTFGNHFIYNKEGSNKLKSANSPTEKINKLCAFSRREDGHLFGTNTLLEEGREDARTPITNWNIESIDQRNEYIAHIVNTKAWPI